MAEDRDETKMVDVSGSEIVEVTITRTADGHTVWVNVDGVCRFRAYRAKRVITETKPLNYVWDSKSGGTK